MNKKRDIKKQIEFEGDNLVSEFAYQLVREALGLEVAFLSDLSSLWDFGYSDKKESQKKYNYRPVQEAFEKIEKYYGISLDEFNDYENSYDIFIYKLANFVFNELDKKEEVK